MKTVELTPAASGLIQDALNCSAIEFSEVLQSYEGKYAAEIVQEALMGITIDTVYNEIAPANLGLMRRRLKELKREANR